MPQPRLTFTFDLEDHRPDGRHPRRYPEVTRRVLAGLEAWGVRGTVFVVGAAAKAAPDLIRDIAEQGHEIAFHSFDHVPLPQQTREKFQAETVAGKRLLEDLTGKAVTGFRAPVFSLTQDAQWALDVLRDAGFTYSSSVLPAPSPLFGFSDAPASPFFWPNGLLELPAPVARLGPLVLPYLGGIYLRYLPGWVVRACIARAPADAALWTYFHPYDFDPGEAFFRMKGAGWITSALLWCNRRRTEGKLEALFGPDGYEAMPPFAEQIGAGIFAKSQVFQPAS